MRNCSMSEAEQQLIIFRRLKKLMETPPKVDRNRTPPPCRICPYYQPEFRYRTCLYADCPYGKARNTAFRKRPLKREMIVAGGGGMRV